MNPTRTRERRDSTRTKEVHTHTHTPNLPHELHAYSIGVVVECTCIFSKDFVYTGSPILNFRPVTDKRADLKRPISGNVLDYMCKRSHMIDSCLSWQ
jgi:hypothetical protein